MIRFLTTWLPAIVIAIGVAALWHWAVPVQPELTELHGTIERFRRWNDARPLFYAAGFFGASIGLLLLPVPLVLLALIAGAIFDFWPGLVLISAASTIAATLLMLASRYVLAGPLKARLNANLTDRLERLNAAVDRDGAMTLLSLRLTPAVPFHALNLAAGLTSIRLRSYVIVTLIGKLPMIAIFVGAGNHLADVERVADIMTPRVIAILFLLAVFPWLARWTARQIRKARAG
ncbi:TVP38/TMEM64 family protein [Paracoccus caeni]|uniref:TVP38/TMEM64 family membrane protein n=1 Tax=Paracoccus caeni TaxID=657651 RepID=A0A934VX08_9RHOB|nr:VTT domain-containing protein [Paracoccus caeni]MBK4214487.1 TVP38/TMEM64 family protein [Paracoccus caeni]